MTYQPEPRQRRLVKLFDSRALPDAPTREWMRAVYTAAKKLERKDRAIKLLKALLIQVGDRHDEVSMLTELASTLEERCRWQEGIIRDLSGSGNGESKHGR